MKTKAESIDEAFDVGFAVALSALNYYHDKPELCADTFNKSGYKKSDVQKLNLNKWDRKSLLDVWKLMK